MKMSGRIAWSAVVRISKPKIEGETGIPHYVFGLVITSAVFRNQNKSFEFKYSGTDINSKFGELPMPTLTDCCILMISILVTTL
jgi:hypothetical protein